MELAGYQKDQMIRRLEISGLGGKWEWGQRMVSNIEIKTYKNSRTRRELVDWGRNPNSQKVADPDSGPFQTWPYITLHLAVYQYPF